ncbi:MAG: NADH-quinone oxidoreductase subunit N [Gemmatimonadota bacterium]|nr:NADH-quinone oxidoreductase subunit N [Candidatus Palauibacterales bacterium]
MQIDFSNQLHYFWALLPETVLIVCALLLLVVDGFWKGRKGPGRAVGSLSLVALALAAAANYWLLGVAEVGTTGAVAIDSYRIFTNFIFLGAAALTVLISFDYVAREGIDLGEYYILLLFCVVGMMLLAASRDLILIFLGFELMSFAAYVLTAFKRDDPKSSEAGLKYFLLGAFSSAFLVYGMALIFGAGGTTNLGVLREILVAGDISPMLAGGIVLLTIGFAFKVSAVPFHVWTPDAYEGAPTPFTAFMATAIKAGAFAAFIRIFVIAFGDLHIYWERSIWWLAVLTMIVPNLIALVQDDIKRLLAYSSIAHAGYLLVALISANESGMASFLFYLVAYTVMTIGAFAIVLVIAGKNDRLQRIRDYSGLGWTHPWPAAMLALFLVSLAGLPPTGGFIGKFYILRASIEAGYPNLAVILAFATLVSYWYYLRVIVSMYMRTAESPLPRLEWSGSLRTAVAICALITVFLGLLPSWPLLKAQQSVEGLVRVTERVSDSFGVVAQR